MHPQTNPGYAYVCKCTPSTPSAPQVEQFRTFFADLEVYLLVIVLDRLLRATTKKVVNFFEYTPRQNPGYAYETKSKSGNVRDCIDWLIAAPLPLVWMETVHVYTVIGRWSSTQKL